MKLRKKYKITGLLLLIATLLLCSFSSSNNVKALYYDSWAELPMTPGSTLTGNYKFSGKNKTITASSTQSGLIVRGEVNIYIPMGSILIVKGGAAQNTESIDYTAHAAGAGAGIELPTGSTLNVYGGGAIQAIGGNGSMPRQGSSPISKEVAGPGGNGGAGSGAGIGGKGGYGGGQGALNGENGGSMGVLRVFDSSSINAAGGSSPTTLLEASAGFGGTPLTGAKMGASGNGGYSGNAATIGGGGGGGGAGSAPLKGSPMYGGYGGPGGGSSFPNIALGGGGGCVNGIFTASCKIGSDRDGASSRGRLGGTIPEGTTTVIPGGDAGFGGRAGTIYASDISKVNVDGDPDISYVHGQKSGITSMSKVILDNNNGTSSELKAATGALPGITVFPIKDGYTFTGYYGVNDGVTSKYIDANGASTGLSWSPSVHPRIYAGWKANTYQLRIVGDGTDFTVSGAVDKGSGIFDMIYGQNVTVTATAHEGLNFIAWYANPDIYSSTEQVYTFKPPMGPLTLTATSMKGVWVEDTLIFDTTDFTAASETKYSDIQVDVTLDGVNSDLGDVALYDRAGNFVTNLTGKDGIYTNTGILDPSGEDYYIYLNGENTNETINFNNEGLSKKAIKYYSLTVSSTKDGVPYNPGNLVLKNQDSTKDDIALSYNDDTGKAYYHMKENNDDTYDLLLNDENVGYDNLQFNNTKNIELNFHSALIETKLDGTLKAMGEITLVSLDDKVKYTISSTDGIYEEIARESGSYRIFINGKDTGESVVFDSNKKVIDFYQVTYELKNGGVGTTPLSKIYQKGTGIKVAGIGNIKRADYHFAGWKDKTVIYPAGSSVDVVDHMAFEDVWEADADSQARWSFDGTDWSYGTIADAVNITMRNSTFLKVEVQKNGSLPKNTDMVVRDNQSWTINTGVELEMPSGTSISNQGVFTNNGVLSGQGTLKNTGKLENDLGIVVIPSIDNENGTLIGGTYGEILGASSKKVEIIGGIIKEGESKEKVVLGDYSSTKNVKTASVEDMISVMGGGVLNAKPSEQQLLDHFGGFAEYIEKTNVIEPTASLYYRTANTTNDIVVDPGDKEEGGEVTPQFKVNAEVYEKKEIDLVSNEFIPDEGGEATIKLGSSSIGPNTRVEMSVKSGSTITLVAKADKGAGYRFVGWYELPEIIDGVMINAGTLLTSEVEIDVAINADAKYYALFEKVKYTLKIETDPATKAKIEVDEVEKKSLAINDKADIEMKHGESVSVKPEVQQPEDSLKGKYSFLGYFKNYADTKTEKEIRYEKVPIDPDWKCDKVDPKECVLPDDQLKEIPLLFNYETLANKEFNYSLSTMTVIRGYLHYNLNGGAADTVDNIEDTKLETGKENIVEITSGIPIKAGWIFKHWQRVDSGASTPNPTYKAGEDITLTGDESDAGVLMMAVYERDVTAKFFVKYTNVDGDSELGFRTLDAAVAATKDSKSLVYKKTEILYLKDSSAGAVNSVYGTLPNGYVIKPYDGVAIKLEVLTGSKLTIGNETISNSDNDKSQSWKSGAHSENIDFISKGGDIELDGQHSWIENGNIVLYPSNRLHLLSDLNTTNMVNILLWDSNNVISEFGVSTKWVKDGIIVTSDTNDGDDSLIDGSDSEFNLMGGRVRVINDGYALYNDNTKLAVNNGYSLRVFASSKVSAMRKPFISDTIYQDSEFVLQYRSIQEAIDDASRSNAGGKGEAEDNSIYVVANSDEDFIIKGDNPGVGNAQFADYRDKTYNNSVNLMNGKRTKSGMNLTVEEFESAKYELSGNINVEGVKSSSPFYNAGTHWYLHNFKISGQVLLENGSYLSVDVDKEWELNEIITIEPKVEADGKIAYMMPLVKESGNLSDNFKLDDATILNGYTDAYTDVKDQIYVSYLGAPLSVKEDPVDARTFLKEPYVFKTVINYPTGISEDPLVNDEVFQNLTYQWEYSSDGGVTWNNATGGTPAAVYDAGEATITYEKTIVDRSESGWKYRCLVENDRSRLNGIELRTANARVVIEESIKALVQIPKEIKLKLEKGSDIISNKELNEADKQNEISLIINPSTNLMGDESIPNGTFKISATPQFYLTNGVNTDYKSKYFVQTYKSDNKTILSSKDSILMELKASGIKKQRFYLRGIDQGVQPLGKYQGVMNFGISYVKEGISP